MNEYKNWLVDCQPRLVQTEATLRSYEGIKTRDSKDEEPRITNIHGGNGSSRGWCHFMEMRLGKTPTALNEFMLYKRDHGIKHFVCWSPNSFKQAWVDEAEKLGVDVPFFAYDSTGHKKIEAELAKAKDGFGLIVNYEAAKAEKTQALIAEICGNPVYMAADESINIKNPNSLQTKAVLALGKEAAVTRPLTGLPFTQGVHDMFAQLRFAKRLNGSNFFAFRNKYCKMGGFKGKSVVGVRAENQDQLDQLLGSSAFVAKRREWGSITEPEYAIDEIAMTPEQAKAYKEMDEDFLTVLADEQTIVTADLVLTKLIKLQQISSGFIMFEGKTHLLMEPAKIPKIVRLQETLDNEIDGKTIVVYHHKQSLENLLEALVHLEPAVIGSKEWMHKNERDVEAEKKRFNLSSACRVCLVAFGPGKYGHTLIGTPQDRCATTLFYENTYSLDDRLQLEARNTMDHQDWVNLYVDYVGGAVERASIRAIQRKENVVSAVLGHYGLTDRVRIE